MPSARSRMEYTVQTPRRRIVRMKCALPKGVNHLHVDRYDRTYHNYLGSFRAPASHLFLFIHSALATDHHHSISFVRDIQRSCLKLFHDVNAFFCGNEGRIEF